MNLWIQRKILERAHPREFISNLLLKKIKILPDTNHSSPTKGIHVECFLNIFKDLYFVREPSSCGKDEEEEEGEEKKNQSNDENI